jgi:hypothetical protein
MRTMNFSSFWMGIWGGVWTGTLGTCPMEPRCVCVCVCVCVFVCVVGRWNGGLGLRVLFFGGRGRERDGGWVGV